MSEISDLRRSRNQKINQKNQCESTINSINIKLSRLESAKYAMGLYKTDAKNQKSAAANVPDGLTPWEGDKKNTYINSANMLESDMEGYYKSCDRALDAICDAITRLENERSNQYGLLGRLVSAINSLGNEIEKLLN